LPSLAIIDQDLVRADGRDQFGGIAIGVGKM
jgi:hypothetical protein